MEISEHYNFAVYKIGYEKNHVNFLIQVVPWISASKLVTLIKSLTARELFKRDPEIKHLLRWGNFVQVATMQILYIDMAIKT